MLRKLAFAILGLTLLTACTSSGRNTPETPTALPTATIPPTPGTPLTILILPADLPQDEYDSYQTLIYDLAQASQMRFQVLNALSVEEMQAELPALKVVVAIAPDPGLAALAAAAPQVQFLGIGIPGLRAMPNLSTVGAEGPPVDQQAFLAGYIAGMLAPEWRVGILTQRDTPGGEAARTGFEHGYSFYCGDCFNPNFNQPNRHGLYPIIVRIPVDESEANYRGYADLLLDNQVNVAYVFPAVATREVTTYLAQYGALLVGETLPSEDLRASWIVSIQADPISAIQAIFPELVAGNGGQVLETPLVLQDVNPSLLSEGKQNLVQEILDGLQNGTIDPGVTP